jgi:hypothetical protein
VREGIASFLRSEGIEVVAHADNPKELIAAVDEHHQLLGHRERVLLRRVSVFAGSWTREAAHCATANGCLTGWGALVDDNKLQTQSERTARRASRCSKPLGR